MPPVIALTAFVDATVFAIAVLAAQRRLVCAALLLATSSGPARHADRVCRPANADLPADRPGPGAARLRAAAPRVRLAAVLRVALPIGVIQVLEEAASRWTW